MSALRDERFLGAYGPPVQLASDLQGDGPRWVQICREGRYKGHHSSPVVELSREMFLKVVENFRADPAYKPGPDGKGQEGVVAFDYEHASEAPATSGSIPQGGAPAAGWVLDLDIRQGPDGKAELWALAEFGAKALEQIRAKEYRWTSVAIWPKAVHPETGEQIGPRLTSVALTNQPFVRGMAPIAAAAHAAQLWADPGHPPDGLLPTSADPNTSRDDTMSEQKTPELIVKLAAAFGVDSSDELAILAAAKEAKPATDLLAQLKELFGNVDPGEIVKKATEAEANAKKYGSAAKALEKLKAALAEREEKEADEEAEKVAASMAKDDEDLRQRIGSVIKLARRACINEDGTLDAERIAKFRQDWPVKDEEPQASAQGLTTPLLAKGSTQLGGAATAVPQTAPLQDQNGPTVLMSNGSRVKVDEVINGYPGRNPVEKARNYLLKERGDGFASLPLATQMRFAGHFSRTGQVPSE